MQPNILMSPRHGGKLIMAEYAVLKNLLYIGAEPPFVPIDCTTHILHNYHSIESNVICFAKCVT
jgi:hypothetical protein